MEKIKSRKQKMIRQNKSTDKEKPSVKEISFNLELDKKLDFVDISYPKDIVASTGKPAGPVEGLGLTPEQTGKNKPSSVLPIEGLYAVGDTCGKKAHGIGIQLAANSGLHCADAILGIIDKNEI